MQRVCPLILLALLTLALGSAAWGQDQKMMHEEKNEVVHGFNVIPPAQPTSTLKGIKITESGFDPETKTLKLAFMNDRAADITAYHYCFMIMSANPEIAGEQCKLIDALKSVLTMRAEKWNPAIKLVGPDGNFVHPGEIREIIERIGWNDSIYSGSIYIDEVAWSDGTFEGPGQFIIAERTAELREREFVSKTIRGALSSGLGPELVASVISTLQTALRQEEQHPQKDDWGKRAEVLYDAIHHLEQPERHKGNTEKFIPANQSEFLSQFLLRHDSFSQEASKHVSLRKADVQ